MAGCSIVALSILFAPLMLVISLVMLVAYATVEFVTSPAFPLMLASLLFFALATVDGIRLLWRKWRDRDGFELGMAQLRRPLVLTVIGCILMAVTIGLAASMLFGWWQSLQ